MGFAMRLATCLFALTGLWMTTVAAADIRVPMYVTSATGRGAPVGVVTIQQTKYGLLFIPDLRDLRPGPHGFHIHQVPSCADNGMAAGGHLDPQHSGKHLGPYNDHGHLGDLPVLSVNANGTATTPVLAPKLRHLADVRQMSLMIHEGGDNYADTPQQLGGGGGRMVCGVIP